MKSCIKNRIFFLYVILISFFSSSRFEIFKEVIYICVFVALVLCLYFIKNRYVAYGLSVILLAGYSVYNINLALFMIPVFLLIVVHRYYIEKINALKEKKKHKSEMNHIWLHLLIALGVAEAIYAAVSFYGSDYHTFIGTTDTAVIVAEALIAVFALGAFSETVKSKARHICKVNNSDYVTLIFINFIGVFLFGVALFLNYVTPSKTLVNISIVCLPWAVWLAVMVYEKNPVTEAIFIVVEEKLKKISERCIKEK